MARIFYDFLLQSLKRSLLRRPQCAIINLSNLNGEYQADESGCIMLEKILIALRQIRGWLGRFFLGIESDSPVDDKSKPVEADSRPDSDGSEKPPALPVTDKYQKIDWDNNPPQYRKRKGVLSYRERVFFRALRGVMGRENHILSMVRMADVLWLANETEDRKFHNNNILCKHFDYVVCRKLDFEPILIVELNDPSHQWEHRWQVDEFKKKACKEAGLPMLSIRVQEEYDRAEIRQKIDQVLNPG